MHHPATLKSLLSHPNWDSHSYTYRDPENKEIFLSLAASPSDHQLLYLMDSKKPSNKISEIVRLQQILKKWKKLANSPKNNGSSSSKNGSINKLLKKTLSFTDISSNTECAVIPPKGFLAVCVGKELKRFIIPMEYLGHQAFRILLREAEEEFGFQQEGVLKIPCEVGVFERILKVVEDKTDYHHLIFLNNNAHDKEIINIINGCCSSSSDSELTPSHHPQLCR